MQDQNIEKFMNDLICLYTSKGSEIKKFVARWLIKLLDEFGNTKKYESYRFKIIREIGEFVSRYPECSKENFGTQKMKELLIMLKK